MPGSWKTARSIPHTLIWTGSSPSRDEADARGIQLPRPGPEGAAGEAAGEAVGEGGEAAVPKSADCVPPSRRLPALLPGILRRDEA